MLTFTYYKPLILICKPEAGIITHRIMPFVKYKETLIRLALVAAMSFVMALMLFMPASAENYDCAAYGAGAYGEAQVCGAATPETPPATDRPGLINTGQMLSAIIPASMITAGTIMLYRLNRRQK